MKITNHQEITRAAIGERFSERALKVIIGANIGQDALKFQFGHDHHHYDNNKFTESDAYVFQLRAECVADIRAGNITNAWMVFGKLTHSVQDFYAHSNYIELFPKTEDIPPRMPGDELPNGLISGKLYYPLEAVTFIPGMPEEVIRLFPADSHARLNKDDEDRPYYRQARALAIVSTVAEVGKIMEQTSEVEQNSFFDRTGSI